MSQSVRPEGRERTHARTADRALNSVRRARNIDNQIVETGECQEKLKCEKTGEDQGDAERTKNCIHQRVWRS